MPSIPERFGVPDHAFRVVIGSTKIEFDENKEQKNRSKHGYSLESAKYILESFILHFHPPLLFRGPEKTGDEFRSEIMSLDDTGKVVLFFVVTMRPNESVRIISLREADDKEAKIYRGFTP